MLVLKFLKYIHFLIWARPPQAFFFYITLKRTLCHGKWYQFHFSTMICIGITTSVAFFFVHGCTLAFSFQLLFTVLKNVKLLETYSRFLEKSSTSPWKFTLLIVIIFLRENFFLEFNDSLKECTESFEINTNF